MKARIIDALIVALFFPLHTIGQSLLPEDIPEPYTSKQLEINGTVSGSTISLDVQASTVSRELTMLPGYPNCTVSNVIQGFGFDDNKVENGFYFQVPAPSGAAGKRRLVAVGNRIIEVRSKTGRLIFRDSLQDFFSSLDTKYPKDYLFDPKVVYDEHEGRFVVVSLMLSDNPLDPTLSSIFLAVSKNELPDTVTEWYFYEIPSAIVINGEKTWADYPGFEVDEKAIYITNNMISFNDYSDVGSRLWIVPKGVAGGFYSGGSPTFFGPYNPYQVAGSRPATTMPAQVHGVGGLGASLGTYLVSFILGSSTTNSTAQVFTISSPLSGAPKFTLTKVNLGIIAQDTFDLPWAPQRGTSTRISTNDVRALDAVWRNNTLWMTNTINPRTPGVDAGQATAHWVQLSTAGGTIKLVNQGNMGGESFSSTTSTYYPAIAVNKQGITAVGYSASSPSMYAGAYGSLLIGTDEVPFTVKAGVDYYIRELLLSNRWGEYTGISVDPVDDSFWVFNQFANVRGSPISCIGREDGRWTTVWSRVHCTTITKSPQSPTKAPTKAPVKVPVKAPVKVPVKAPVKAPVKVPVKVPIKAPVKDPSLRIRRGECTVNSKCGLCEGDCDGDDECEFPLVCFYRSRQGFLEVPGCSGGSSDASPIDYCVDPNLLL